MDNDTNTEIIESGTTETNVDSTESTVSTEVTDKTTDETSTEQATEQTNEATEPTTPEKIKLDDAEYTPEEIKAALELQKNHQAEIEKNQYQPRELAVIEADINRINQDFTNDLTTLSKKFIAKSQIPMVDVQDPNTGDIIQQPAYDFTQEQAFNHGVETGQWDYFITLLNPVDAAAFVQEKEQLLGTYQAKYTPLQNEHGYIQHTEAKKADIVKWDGYIKEKYNTNPAESYLLGELKNKYDFDATKIDEFVSLFRKAKAIEQNKSDLANENEAAKDLMMNSSISGSQKSDGGQHIFTRAEIDKMSQREFEKHEKQIDEQYIKGLIK